MTHYRKQMHVGALVAAALLAAHSLAAQGGPQQRRAPTSPAPAPAADNATTGALTLQLAGEMLKSLVGTWRFEVRFAGNFTGGPDGSGTRIFAPLFDDLRLEWRESLDSSKVTSQGIIGFDPNNGRFYSTAVYSSAPGVELLAGTLDLAEPLVAFSPLAPAIDDGGAPRPGMGSFTLRLIDQDHFTWSPLDRSWRAVFTRQPH